MLFYFACHRSEQGKRPDPLIFAFDCVLLFVGSSAYCASTCFLIFFIAFGRLHYVVSCLACFRSIISCLTTSISTSSCILLRHPPSAYILFYRLLLASLSSLSRSPSHLSCLQIGRDIQCLHVGNTTSSLCASTANEEVFPQSLSAKRSLTT